MSGLTYLGDACVLWNSVVRYKNELIYTYSGLFCIAINPYKRFPIYTQRSMEIYIGKRRSECPPHIFGVAEGSYQGMMNLGKNQSILITGESGAGKTENTKKVISYFASIGATGKKKEGEIELEESNIAHEGTLAALRQKHNNNMSEMGEQIDSLNKMKAKADKDKAGMERDLQECRATLDEAMRERANHERNGKLTQGLIVKLTKS